MFSVFSLLSDEKDSNLTAKLQLCQGSPRLIVPLPRDFLSFAAISNTLANHFVKHIEPHTVLDKYRQAVHYLVSHCQSI
jgi:hypothetical protein